jgi:hypothetical protein
LEIEPSSLSNDIARQACHSAKEALLGQRYEDVSSIERLAGNTNDREAKSVYSDLSSFLKGVM